MAILFNDVCLIACMQEIDDKPYCIADEIFKSLHDKHKAEALTNSKMLHYLEVTNAK